MAVETAKKFLERLEREETLREQLYVSSPKDLEKFVQFAHGKGFVVRKEDMATALQEFKPKLKTANLEPLKQLVSGS
jgi:predicted ribosomally synthesized peptide with nif11-like leader